MNQSDKEIAINVESVDHSGEIIQQLHIIFQEIFTKEFLDSDPILQRQVNNPLSLPTSAIYQCSKILSITDDHDLIRRALESSTSLIVTDSIVRPNMKAEQHTVILREVEDTISEEAIREMFTNASCPSIVSCRSEANNNWFIVFQSESEARLALEKIKTSTLGGKPVRARLKTESLIRRTPSGSTNSSPTYRAPPSLIIDDSTANSTSSNSTTQQPAQPFYYPHLMPMAPNQMSGSPQFPGMYYMYPPPMNGFIPHPMHPIGSPMYMGGVWPSPYMVPVSPNLNGPPNQQNRPKSKQKSPRNTPNQQYSRNQNRSTKNPSQGQPDTPGQNDLSTSNEIPDAEPISDSRKDQNADNNGKKKTFKKKKERNNETSADETAQNGGESHGNVEDKKKKDSNFSHFPNNQNGKVHNSQSENYKGKYKDGKDKSKAGKQNAAAPKQEHKFNLEADFPSLLNTPASTNPPPAAATGISWAARISKQTTQDPPTSKSNSPQDTIKTSSPEIVHSSDHQELNISFGNVPVSTSPNVEIILPSHFSSNGGTTSSKSSKSSSVMTPSPPLTSQPIIMSNSQENVEYVPISFGAFDAAPSSTDESESNTNGSTNDVKKKYADIIRKTGNK